MNLLPNMALGEVVKTCCPCQLYGALGAMGVHYGQDQLERKDVYVYGAYVE